MTNVNEAISALGFPDDIEIKAREIYGSFSPEIKKTKRVNKIVFLCVSEAHKALHVVYDPIELAKLLKINKVNNIIKEAARCGYRPILCHYEPNDWLSCFMKKIGINPAHRNNIVTMINLTLETFPNVNEKKPQAIAAGAVAFFATINGYKYNEDEFGLSNSIVKAMKNMVSQAHAL